MILILILFYFLKKNIQILEKKSKIQYVALSKNLIN
jgi:hypothetical protein